MSRLPSALCLGVAEHVYRGPLVDVLAGAHAVDRLLHLAVPPVTPLHGVREPTGFYLGKLQDGLALDQLTGYSALTVPFFAAHKYARQVILTESACVQRLLPLAHSGHTVLSWSLNPPEVAHAFELGAPPVCERLRAMKRCADRGYPVRAVIMPVIPVLGWEIAYPRFVTELLEAVPIQRLTLGGICSYQHARELMERKLGTQNAVSREIASRRSSPDGRKRYPPAVRVSMYSRIIEAARRARPDVEMALCLEEPSVWKELGLEGSMGRCNCIW